MEQSPKRERCCPRQPRVTSGRGRTAPPRPGSCDALTNARPALRAAGPSFPSACKRAQEGGTRRSSSAAEDVRKCPPPAAPSGRTGSKPSFGCRALRAPRRPLCPPAWTHPVSWPIGVLLCNLLEESRAAPQRPLVSQSFLDSVRLTWVRLKLEPILC